MLLVIEHDRRRVLHVNLTKHPTAAWVTQQLREALPFERRPRYLLLDRDSIFSAEVEGVLRHMEVCPVRTSFQSPWQNGVAERWVGSCRRELLDHMIVLNEQHLRGSLVGVSIAADRDPGKMDVRYGRVSDNYPLLAGPTKTERCKERLQLQP